MKLCSSCTPNFKLRKLFATLCRIVHTHISMQEGKRQKLDTQSSPLPSLVEAPASPEMTTLWGGVYTATDSSHVSVARALSSSQAPCRSTDRSPFAYKGVEDLCKMIKEKKSARGTSSEQVLYFQPVSPSQFDKIQGVREKIGKGVKMGHIADQELLILELMPGADHENACEMFGFCVKGALQQMGVNLLSDLRCTHSK